jgi:hypothetical protein
MDAVERLKGFYQHGDEHLEDDDAMVQISNFGSGKRKRFGVRISTLVGGEPDDPVMVLELDKRKANELCRKLQAAIDKIR